MRSKQKIIKILILNYILKKIYEYYLKEAFKSDSVSGAMGKKTEYLYDELYRLTKVIHRERNNSYALYQYDKAGNRLKMRQDQGEYDYTIATDSNQLIEIVSNKAGKTKLSYDKNGNLKTDVGCLPSTNLVRGEMIDDSEKYRKKYLWDSENRLMAVKINKKNSNDTFTVAFAYNGDGQRIYKETSIEDESENETKLSAILYIRNSFGETIEEHSLDLSSLPSNIYHLSSTYIFGNGKRIMSVNSSDSKTYYLSDILGSNSLLTDNSGNPLQLTKYDEFGNTYYEFTQHNEVGAVVDNNYKYTGKPFDREIGLYYYGARYYNPRWGRFVSKDPSQKINKNKSITMNEYLYCLNNPLIFIDIDGLDDIFIGYVTDHSQSNINFQKFAIEYKKRVEKGQIEGVNFDKGDDRIFIIHIKDNNDLKDMFVNKDEEPIEHIAIFAHGSPGKLGDESSVNLSASEVKPSPKDNEINVKELNDPKFSKNASIYLFSCKAGAKNVFFGPKASKELKYSLTGALKAKFILKHPSLNIWGSKKDLTYWHQYFFYKIFEGDVTLPLFDKTNTPYKKVTK